MELDSAATESYEPQTIQPQLYNKTFGGDLHSSIEEFSLSGKGFSESLHVQPNGIMFILKVAKTSLFNIFHSVCCTVFATSKGFFIHELSPERSSVPALPYVYEKHWSLVCDDSVDPSALMNALKNALEADIPAHIQHQLRSIDCHCETMNDDFLV